VADKLALLLNICSPTIPCSAEDLIGSVIVAEISKTLSEAVVRESAAQFVECLMPQGERRFERGE
jgi:hypothetical protein